MPRIDFANMSDDENVVRVKIPTKPRNPADAEMFDGKYPPKRHADRRKKLPHFDKRQPKDY